MKSYRHHRSRLEQQGHAVSTEVVSDVVFLAIAVSLVLLAGFVLAWAGDDNLWFLSTLAAGAAVLAACCRFVPSGTRGIAFFLCVVILLLVASFARTSRTEGAYDYDQSDHAHIETPYPETPRIWVLHELLEQNDLMGRPRTEVEKLIGSPDGHFHQLGIDWYWLGRGHAGSADWDASMTDLFVEYDVTDRVIGYSCPGAAAGSIWLGRMGFSGR